MPVVLHAAFYEGQQLHVNTHYNYMYTVQVQDNYRKKYWVDMCLLAMSSRLVRTLHAVLAHHPPAGPMTMSVLWAFHEYLSASECTTARVDLLLT